MRLLPALLRFVQYSCLKHGIDESHAMGHSMDVLYYANNIFLDTVKTHPSIKSQEPLIYTSAILHDMCDKKYVIPKEGIQEITQLLNYNFRPYEIEAIKHIMITMSYSYVKQNGFPLLGKYQMAYHIVREADLLSAYDFDRAIIYNMYHTNNDVLASYENSRELFEKRMFRHNDDGLFLTEYSKLKSAELHEKAENQILSWKRIIDTYEKHV